MDGLLARKAGNFSIIIIIIIVMLFDFGSEVVVKVGA